MYMLSVLDFTSEDISYTFAAVQYVGTVVLKHLRSYIVGSTYTLYTAGTSNHMRIATYVLDS